MFCPSRRAIRFRPMAGRVGQKVCSSWASLLWAKVFIPRFLLLWIVFLSVKTPLSIVCILEMLSHRMHQVWTISWPNMTDMTWLFASFSHHAFRIPLPFFPVLLDGPRFSFNFSVIDWWGFRWTRFKWPQDRQIERYSSDCVVFHPSINQSMNQTINEHFQLGWLAPINQSTDCKNVKLYSTMFSELFRLDDVGKGIPVDEIWPSNKDSKQRFLIGPFAGHLSSPDSLPNFPITPYCSDVEIPCQNLSAHCFVCDIAGSARTDSENLRSPNCTYGELTTYTCRLKGKDVRCQVRPINQSINRFVARTSAVFSIFHWPNNSYMYSTQLLRKKRLLCTILKNLNLFS